MRSIVSTSHTIPTISSMDQNSLLEVLTSVTKVPGSGSDTYINQGYVVLSVQMQSGSTHAIQQGFTETCAQGL